MSTLSRCSIKNSSDCDRQRSIAETRLFVIACVIVLLTLRCGSAQTKEPVVEERTLTVEDNNEQKIELKISYFKSTIGKDAPVVILLHGKSGQRRQWTGVASFLQKNHDYAVVTVDLRGHGESQLSKKAEPRKNDYQAMATVDMQAVKDFVFEEHQKAQLNMNKLGIVACDFSAAVALVFAESDWQKEPYDDSQADKERTPRGQDVQALVLISPEVTVPGLYASKAATSLRGFNSVAVLVATSDTNSHELATAKKLFEMISGKKENERLWFRKYSESVRGMDLILQDRQLQEDIKEFLNKYVKGNQSVWRDRRSRLDRE